MASRRSLRALLRLSSPVVIPAERLASHQFLSSYSFSRCDTTRSNLQQRRPYAVARKAQRGRTMNWGPANLDTITLKDFERALKPDMFKKSDPFYNHDASTYYNCLKKFATVSEKVDHRWLDLIEQAERPTSEILHETGCIMRDMSWNPQASRWSLAMWAAAAERDFNPSIVTLALYLVRSGMFGSSPLFKSAESRFQALAKTGQDPNALLVEGEMLRRRGTYNASIRVFQRALEIGGEDFTWAPLCEQQIAQCYRNLGKENDALEHYRKAVKMGLEEAHEGIAMLSKNADESYESMYKAACLNPKLFSHMAHMELERSSESKDEVAIKEALKWATEWSELSNVPEKA
ncbi:unnamed protein product [Clonostachys rosea]|uniref:Uncharacterized protein n=1 Tax=Bionectria ochroleuca TaxID=29856 RepID=A0ABY6U882_BIOOC|nr:unnamed protein product [Clonostachys rosea]